MCYSCHGLPIITQGWTRSTKEKVTFTRRYSYGALSEPHPGRMLELVEAAKSLPPRLLVVIFEIVKFDILFRWSHEKAFVGA